MNYFTVPSWMRRDREAKCRMACTKLLATVRETDLTHEEIDVVLDWISELNEDCEIRVKG